ncbi:MAG: CNNM domain-containing protein [Planctomycetota bacterium]
MTALLVAAGLFALGLALSAFFSGSETGFYRLSPLRLAVEGNVPAVTRLASLTASPDLFVATMLVGNNVANYLTTVAIGVAATAVASDSGGTAEVLLTWLTAPVVFVLGELLPKTLLFRAPLHFMRPASLPLFVFRGLFFPVTKPLSLLGKLIERLTTGSTRGTPFILRRSRFARIVESGLREGVLGSVQTTLIQNLIGSGSDLTAGVTIPPERLPTAPAGVTRDELLAHARRFGVTEVVLRDGADAVPLGYVVVAELAAGSGDVPACLHPLPRVDANDSRLATLAALRTAGASLGAVYEGEYFLGVVNARGLITRALRQDGPPAFAFD